MKIMSLQEIMDMPWALYADGWWATESLAQEELDYVVHQNAIPIGLVQAHKPGYGWAILYWAQEILFENHRIDNENCLAALLNESLRVT